MIKIRHLTESLNRKYALEEKNVIKKQKSLQESTSNTIKDYSWSKFLDKVEAATGFKVDSAYRRGYDQWIELIDDQGKIRDAEITKYFDGEYELNLSNISTYIHEEYSLVGQDGNAFSLMGYTARCMKECGLRDEIDEMRKLAMSGDYYNLIRVCDDYIQKCNEINPDLDESYNINEEKWGYTLKNGGRLRKAISNEDYRDIIKSIYYCYEELKEKGIIDEDDFERYTDEFDLYLDHDLEDYDEPEEVINYELNDLYDLCDNLNVWVSLDESLNESMYRGLKIYKDDNDLYCAKKGDIVVEDNFKDLKGIKSAIDNELDTWGDDAYPITENLKEDIQKEVFDKPGEFWYFTKHGVGPGSVPKGITVEKTIDKDGGEYFLIKDKILSTYALNKYEIKEKSPEDVDEDWKKPEGDFAGWVAIYQGKKIEIPKNEANSLYDAKLKAIEKLKVPKSKVSLLIVQPGYNESLESNNKNVDEMSFDELLELWWEMNGQWGPVDMGMEPDEIDDYFKENPDELKYNVEQGLKWYE